MHSHVLRFPLKKLALIQPTCLCSALCSLRDADRCALSDQHPHPVGPRADCPVNRRVSSPQQEVSIRFSPVGTHLGADCVRAGRAEGALGNGRSVRAEAQPWRRDTCDSGVPATRRVVDTVVFPRGRQEAQDSLLGAAGAGDTSSPGPGPPPQPLASDLGGALQREKAAASQRCGGGRETAGRVPVRAAAPRPSHPLTPPHTQPLAPPLSHTRRHAHSPSRRASAFHTHGPQARSAEENRRHGVEALTPPRAAAAPLTCMPRRRAGPWSRPEDPRERHRKSRL